ncbi:MAG TPA: chemotaxis protein CheD [Longimicrobiales bacterium]|nr:chemotaxis protein CheD [Longimicrobiales bacterium]
MIEKKKSRRRSSIEFQNEALHHVAVRIGDVKVAGAASLLFTIGLGSCVAIALYDPKSKIGGLAHAMLPHPGDGRRDAPPGRFAHTAVAELLQLMEQEGAAQKRLRARLAGGASMFRDVLEGDGLRLGRRNVEAAHAALGTVGIEVEGEDVFGTYGRSVFLRTTDGKLLVTSVKHDDVIL